MSLDKGFEHIVKRAEPLAPHTWFHLGGPAEYFAETEIRSTSCGRRSVAAARRASMVRLLGGGSNILVRDEGVPGLVVRLSAPAFSEIVVGQANRLGRRRREAGPRHFHFGPRRTGRT